jgi:hypothetical protein
MEERVGIILSKGKEYMGIPYKAWHPNLSCYGDKGPFWAFNGPPPDFSAVKTGLLNSAGLINLLRRELFLEVPGAFEESIYAGGTYEWYVFLDSYKKLKPFKEGVTYPLGTLLLRRFHSQRDEGHMAIISGKNTILSSIRSHGVCETEISRGYYHAVCRPEDWLT